MGSTATTRLLTETITSTFLLEEDRKTGKLVARGEFGRADVPTQNGRRYPRAIYEREVKKLQEDIGKRRVLAELDHPVSGKSSLTRAAALIIEARIESDGRITGAAEILDTPNGRILGALVKHGVAVGVSSRGFGSTKPAEDGNGDEVCEDFVLRTWDFVADPAMKSAYPEVFAESVGGPVDIEALREELPEVFAAIEEGVMATAMERAKATLERASQADITKAVADAVAVERDRFESAMLEAVRGLREDVEAQVRADLLAESAESGATAVLAQVAEMLRPYLLDPPEDHVAEALRERELAVEALGEQVATYRDLAKQAGYQLLAERMVEEHPHAGLARAMLRASGQFEDARQVKDIVENVLGELAAVPVPRSPEAERAQRLAADRKRLMSEEQGLRQQLAERQTQLWQAVEAAEALDARARDAERKLITLQEDLDRAQRGHAAAAYKAEAVAGLTNARELLTLLEGTDDVAAVERVVREQGRRSMADGQLERMRAQLRRGDAAPLAEQVVTAQRGAADGRGLLADLGLNLVEQQTLAGVTE